MPVTPSAAVAAHAPTGDPAIRRPSRLL